MKFAVMAIFIVMAIFGIAVYWMLKPFETGLQATANTSATVNMTNYFGFVETVNYWPIAGWFVLLGIVGFGIYKLMHH